MEATFGNVNSIKEIKEYQIAQEAKENLNTYEVDISFSGYYSKVIEAETEEEAVEEAEDGFSLIDADDWDIENTTVRKIKSGV